MERRGVRVIVRSGVSIDVRIAVHKFISWVRKNKEFPVRLPVYIKPNKSLFCKDGMETDVIFFETFDRKEEPYLSVATGDYEKWLEKTGNKNDALCTILNLVAYGIAYYEVWNEDIKIEKDEIERRKRNLMDDYMSDVDSPL